MPFPSADRLNLSRQSYSQLILAFRLHRTSEEARKASPDDNEEILAVYFLYLSCKPCPWVTNGRILSMRDNLVFFCLALWICSRYSFCFAGERLAKHAAKVGSSLKI